MRHSLSLTELIPLKAFYLGFSLKDHFDHPRIIDRVDESIKKCREGEGIPKRTTFYLLLKCELCRDRDNALDVRVTAKNFCEEKGVEVFFENYMKIVNGTLMLKKVVGSGSISRVEKGKITDREVRQHEDQYGIVRSESVHDLALESLGLNRMNCSDEDYRFLYEVTLREIWNKHFVESQR